MSHLTFVQLARFICVSGWYFFFGLTKLGSCSAGDANGDPGGLIIPSGGGKGGAPGTDDPGNVGGGGGPQPGGRGGGSGGKLPRAIGAPVVPRDDAITAPTPCDI